MSLVCDGLRMRVSVRKTELPLTLPTTESHTSFANALLAKLSRDTRTRATRRIGFLLSGRDDSTAGVRSRGGLRRGLYVTFPAGSGPFSPSPPSSPRPLFSQHPA